MKFPRGLFFLLCLLFLPGIAPLAHAGAVQVRVTDTGGKPLSGAVVMLEPVSGRLPVAPMQGVEISQAKRQFNPAVTIVTVGTAVTFPNFDSVRHHVYSFSAAKNFELKLYSGVPAAPVVFDKPGVAVIGCNIHDQMVAWVVVVDTPLYAVSPAGGRVQWAAVPPGSYRLRVWHAGLRADDLPAVTPLEVPDANVEHDVRLRIAGVDP